MDASTLGLPTDQSAQLHGLLTKRYDAISKDSLYGKAPSALPYCFSKVKPRFGYASMYVPDNVSDDTPVILFLHGYGGSFLYYQEYLSSEFPDHIIICPAFGIGCSKISSEYLAGCMAAASKKVGVKFTTPVLIGLSAGGFGGFREYVRTPSRYKGYICIAAYPPQKLSQKSPAMDASESLLEG